MRNLLYVFRGNTQKRILDKTDERGPYDFLYGYDDLAGPKSYVIAPRADRRTVLEKALGWIEYPFTRITKLGLPLEIGFLYRKEFKRATHLFCVNDAISLGVLAHKRLFGTNAKVVTLFHSLPERLKFFRRNPLMRLWIAFLLNGSDRILTFTYKAHEPLIASFGVKPDKLGVLRFGVDTSYWKPATPESRESFVLSVGNDMNRDYKTLLEALPEGVKLTVVTRKKISEREPGHLTRLTGLGDAELRTLYQRALFSVVPSIRLEYESSGLSTILQNMACRTPVITSWNPAIAELFEDEKDILFYRPQDSGDLKRQMERLKDDPELRQRLARSAHQKLADQFTCHDVARQIEQWVNHG